MTRAAMSLGRMFGRVVPAHDPPVSIQTRPTVRHGNLVS